MLAYILSVSELLVHAILIALGVFTVKTEILDCDINFKGLC